MSPSNSPTHSNQNQLPKAKLPNQQIGGDRKVLSSQNSASSSSSQKVGKSVKNGKVPTEKPTELSESNVNEESEWGWKTYTPRGRNNNLNSVGNKNSQKRTSNGSCGSDSASSNIPSLENEDEETDFKKGNGDDTVTERKSGTLGFGATSASSSLSHSRKQREREKPRNRREGKLLYAYNLVILRTTTYFINSNVLFLVVDRNWRNCISRRLETLVYLWLTHMISALTWLWSLVTDVASLSASLGASLYVKYYSKVA